MAKTTDTVVLLERARRACEEMATVQHDIRQTLAETRRILATAHPEAAYAPASRQPRTTAEGGTDHTMKMVVQEMLTILRVFPLEWQFKIVKILVARMMVMEILPLPSITPSA